MSAELSERSLKLPTFDGDEKKFQLWWMRFQAYSRVYKFAGAVSATPNPDLPSTEDATIDVTTADGKKQAAAKIMNAVCVANFTMAFTSEKLMGIVYKSCTSDWPGGLAHLIVQELLNRYMPKDLISKVELRRALNAVSMKKDEDPSVLFEALSAIENKFTTATFKIQEEELFATVLEKAPQEYMSVLTCEQRKQGNALTLKDLEEAMTQLYRAMQGQAESESSQEIGLLSSDVKCYWCKKMGHKAYQCPDKQNDQNSNGGKFNGKCHNCGKKGHKVSNC